MSTESVVAFGQEALRQFRMVRSQARRKLRTAQEGGPRSYDKLTEAEAEVRAWNRAIRIVASTTGLSVPEPAEDF